MKRNHSSSSSSNHVPFHPNPPPTSFSGGGLTRGGVSGGGYKPVPVDVAGKGKMWEESCAAEQDDELLAVLGYKVRSSDMVSVAQKLEHLEEKMGQAQGDGLTHLGSDAVHYNPSDLYSWLESMISELNPVPADDCFIPPSQTDKFTSAAAAPVSIFEGNSGLPDYDLKAIPGQAIYPVIGQNDSTPANKKLKPTPATVPVAAPVPAPAPVVLIDSQEQGIRLIHTLMACAEAVQQDNLSLAQALVDRMGILAVSQAGAMRKVATYFAEALGRRIFGLLPQTPQDSAFSDLLQMHFYETCPYLKFAHFTANQAILEAFTNKKRVHVIDFSMKQGMQWPALMQALALRPGGPPTFRLTGIGPPSLDNTDHLQNVGWKLAQLAESIHVEFEYRGFVANSVADIDASMLNLREDEVVAVNSVFELHPLLARPGAIEKVFSAVKDMKPEIVTVVEQEANHNGPVFLDRFTEALHYYSTMFDSLESSGGGGVGGGDTVVDMVASNQDKIMSEVYLGRQILNIVACEGFDRVERHETLTQWQARFDSAGFEPVHLGSNAYKQASMLLALFAGGGGYRVEENDGCLMLGWHTRPLIATSAWKLKK